MPNPLDYATTSVDEGPINRLGGAGSFTDDWSTLLALERS